MKTKFLPPLRIAAFHGKSGSERGWGTGAHDDAFFIAGVAEAVRDSAVEDISVTGTQYGYLVANGDLDVAGYDDAGFLRLVRIGLRAGIAARRIALVKHLDLVTIAVADLAQ